MKKITILMSTYNGEKYLDKQLDSIFSQNIGTDYASLSLVVRDDGSSDRTIDILENWTSRLNINIINGENIGVRESFFWLLMNAPDSDFYAFCDQDDIWKRDKVTNALRHIKEDKTLYFSNAAYIDEDDNLIGKNLLKTDFIMNLKRILMCNPANGCTMFWDYKLHRLLRLIDHNTFTMHDEFVCTIAQLFGNVIYDPIPRILYRIHQANVTQVNNFFKKLKIWRSIWFGRKNYQIDKRAKYLLDLYSTRNDIMLSEENVAVLREMATYKEGLNRFRILCHYNRCEDMSVLRSFLMRMILKLL